LQAATDCAACAVVANQHQPPPQQQTKSIELHPGTGKGASTVAGPPRYATRPASGRVRGPPPPQPALPPQPHTTRSPANNNRMEEGGGCPVVSNLPLHSVMQQRCHASASARSPSWPPMPRPRLHRATTARREKVKLPIREQNFNTSPVWLHQAHISLIEHISPDVQACLAYPRSLLNTYFFLGLSDDTPADRVSLDVLAREPTP